MKSGRLILSLIILLSTVSFSIAQDDPADTPHPLATMLALVPDTPEARQDLLAYADIRATEEARGALRYLNAQAFDQFEDGTWMASVGALSALPDFQAYLMSALEDLPEVSGFEFFDIDRTLYFSRPPGIGHILAGDFSASSLDNALSPRDFEIVEETDTVTVWCWIEGCDKGMEQSLRDRLPGVELFGGHLGRREPRALLEESYLVNSANYAVLRSIIGAYEGDFRTLIDDPGYRTIVNTLTAQEGLLRQVMFVPTELVQVADPVAILGSRASDEAIEELRDRLIPEDYEPLPPYELIAYADIYRDGTEYTHILMVFNDADNATTTGEGIIEQFRAGTSLATQQPLMELLETRNATLQPLEVITDEDTGKAIAIVTITNPQPDNNESDTFPRLAWSSMNFRLLVNMIYQRDTSWLATEIALP